MTSAVYAIIFLVFVAIFTREVIAPASKASCDNRWLILASSINVIQMLAAIAAGHFLHTLFAGHSIWHLSESMPAYLGGGLTFLVASFIAYWWHRAMHKSPLFWRVFHQLHHSPQRIEALTAFYAHPFDSIAATLITCMVAYLGFGFNAATAAWAILYVSIFNLYIHSDTHSPRWLGYFIQRPEMHRVHHQFGHHAQNYSLPIWDLLFGTWSNPKERVEHCGFEENQSAMIYDMLRGKDVSS